MSIADCKKLSMSTTTIILLLTISRKQARLIAHLLSTIPKCFFTEGSLSLRVFQQRLIYFDVK